MADRSAALLAEAILSANAVDSLAEQLMDDPPLVLWTACMAARRDGLGLRSVGHAARWLTEHALDVLQWEAHGDGPFDASEDAQADRYAQLVSESLQLADLAAILAAGDGQPEAEAAYLAGLLRNPSQWLAATGGEVSDAVSDPLPEWVPNVSGSPAMTRVGEAEEILSGKIPAASAESDPEACRRRAAAGRRRWLEAVPGPGRRLPAFTARLARAARLEQGYQETLETEKLAAMAEFAAGAGHEINNPLAIIGGRAQLLLKEETDPERRRELASMNTQVKRAYEMIADMRLFARPPRPEPESVELVGLIDSVIADLSPQMNERATSLSRTGEEGPLQIEADPTQLQVAIRAMCKNALEAIGHDGQIEIFAGRTDESVEIRVSDDGPGIDAAHRRHLFDPFYSARQAGRGLGLGLSKCWRIVQNHGGRIDVQSEGGRGTVFTITLPERFGGPGPG